MAFYPGTFIVSLNSNLSVRLIKSYDTINSIFNVNFDSPKIEFSISADINPVKVSISLKGDEEKYLKHNNDLLAVDPLLNKSSIADLYDSSWLLTKSNDSSFLSIVPLNLPGQIVNQTSILDVQLVENSIGNSMWRIEPGTEPSDVILSLSNESSKNLGVDGNDNIVFTENDTIWTLRKLLSYASNDTLIMPKLDYLLGKTVHNLVTRLITRSNLQNFLTPKQCLYHSITLLSLLNPNSTGEHYSLTINRRFIVNRALSGTDKYCSFQSLLFPGYWLRHDNFGLKLDKFVDTQEFKNDATWKMSFGFLNDASLLTVSIEPLAYPGMFINIENLSVKRTDEPEIERISFYLEEVRPDMMRRKRRNIDEL